MFFKGVGGEGGGGKRGRVKIKILEIVMFMHVLNVQIKLKELYTLYIGNSFHFF